MRVLLTGGSGMVGRAMRRLAPQVAPHLTLLAPDRATLPLDDRAQVAAWIADHRIDAIIHAAARVGGIQANIDDPTGFLADNLRLADAVLMGAHQAGVGRLVNLGSSCMYPRDWRQPLVEDDILAGPLEPTNEGYALAKITAARLCQAVAAQYPGRIWRTLIPCNLFGPEDHFGAASAHLVAAAITKVLVARRDGADTVEIWGSGRARREFMAADHLARFVLGGLGDMDRWPAVMNIGAGRDHSVTEYYRMIADVAGWRGRFVHDPARPEGMMAKLMSSDRARAQGWRPPQDLRADLATAIAAAQGTLN